MRKSLTRSRKQTSPVNCCMDTFAIVALQSECKLHSSAESLGLKKTCFYTDMRTTLRPQTAVMIRIFSASTSTYVHV